MNADYCRSYQTDQKGADVCEQSADDVRRGGVCWGQGDTQRCRLSWLTNSALVYEPKCGGGGCGVSANEYSCTQEPRETWRSNSIFHLWSGVTTGPKYFVFCRLHPFSPQPCTTTVFGSYLPSLYS